MDSPSLPSRVLIAYDATKDLGNDEIQVTIKEVRMRGDILRRGDTLVVFGVLHKIQHPSKCLLNFVLHQSHLFLISWVLCWYSGSKSQFGFVDFVILALKSMFSEQDRSSNWKNYRFMVHWLNRWSNRGPNRWSNWWRHKYNLYIIKNIYKRFKIYINKLKINNIILYIWYYQIKSY